MKEVIKQDLSLDQVIQNINLIFDGRLYQNIHYSVYNMGRDFSRVGRTDIVNTLINYTYDVVQYDDPIIALFTEQELEQLCNQIIAINSQRVSLIQEVGDNLLEVIDQAIRSYSLIINGDDPNIIREIIIREFIPQFANNSYAIAAALVQDVLGRIEPSRYIIANSIFERYELLQTNLHDDFVYRVEEENAVNLECLTYSSTPVETSQGIMSEVYNYIIQHSDNYLQVISNLEFPISEESFYQQILTYLERVFIDENADEGIIVDQFIIDHIANIAGVISDGNSFLGRAYAQNQELVEASSVSYDLFDSFPDMNNPVESLGQTWFLEAAVVVALVGVNSEG